MKRIILTTIAVLLLFIIASAAWYVYKMKAAPSVKTAVSLSSTLLKKAHSKGSSLEKYAKENNCNTEICFLIDMKLNSGSNRFFIYNMKKDSIMASSLVAHGRCNENWLTGRRYGNDIGCGCTSLGKYKVGNPYQGRFGLAYKLHGLDATNNNAFKRFVVLHSHECIPNAEVDPYPICQSDGCPTVSAAFLKRLAGILDKSSKPVLMNIYE